MEMIPVQAQILRGCQCTRSTAMGHRTECSILPNQSVSLMTKGPKKHLSAFSPEIIIIQINFKLCHFCKREDIVDHVRHTAIPRHQHKHTLTPPTNNSFKWSRRAEGTQISSNFGPQTPPFLALCVLRRRMCHFILMMLEFNWFKRPSGATWANPSNFYKLKLQWTHDSLLSFELSSSSKWFFTMYTKCTMCL